MSIMNPYIKTNFKAEDDDEPKSKKENDFGFINKKLEQYFFEKRAIYFWGGVDDKSAQKIVQQLLLLEYDKPGDPIKLYINSPGGVITSGLVIYDTIGLIHSPVHTIAMGLAASMGSILLCCGTPGHRFIYPHAEVMIHQPSIGGYFQANSTDIEIQANQIKKIKDITAKILAKHCQKSIEQILEDCERDYWMNASEAIDYGIVDKLIEK
ncbi:MAG: ATP-dependent Clp protease proteolytic subunit [Alphaproteobacteria bacterium]|nr:ATP-dependent Clp protease proteolytic subunit [Alphaproteobacteria bacterium]